MSSRGVRRSSATTGRSLVNDWHNDKGEDEPESDRLQTSLAWCGSAKRLPVLLFTARCVSEDFPVEKIAGVHRMSYKLVRTECRLLRRILHSYGFMEVHTDSSCFNLMWTGGQVKPQILRSLAEFQRVNHFPRSYELTRKDRLCKNIQRLQHTKGRKHFNIIPPTYVLPADYGELYARSSNDRGPWIVKPASSSRGRGIFMITHPSQLPHGEQLVVQRYITNPLLVDGFKFDLRLYVLVTSFDPLRIYLYEEGLTRYATKRYSNRQKDLDDEFMHLTNYSINKNSGGYRQSTDDAEREDYGNKWTLGACLRYLKLNGIDTGTLMMRIEDVVIKTIVSGELHIAAACRTYEPYRSNCFELFGFDVLVDDTLKPWLLEVNLSPSLACEYPLDLKIKSNLVADTLSIAGVVVQTPTAWRDSYGSQPAWLPGGRKATARPNHLGSSSVGQTAHIFHQADDEFLRRGGYQRIFPTETTWPMYGGFLEHASSHNYDLHCHLFPDRMKGLLQRPATSTAASSAGTRSLMMARELSKGAPSDVLAEQCPSLVQRLHRYINRLPTYRESPLCLVLPHAAQQSPSTSTMLTNTEKSTDDEKSSHSDDSSSERPHHQTSSEGFATEGNKEKRSGRAISLVSLNSSQKADKPEARSTVVSRGSVYSQQLKLPAVTAEQLSDIQVRQAFSCYLQRVHDRILRTSDQLDMKTSPQQQHQMEIVMDFLKAAASNMKPPFVVQPLSARVSWKERCLLLAEQLKNFLLRFTIETDQMQTRGDHCVYTVESPITEADYGMFLDLASEDELEQILSRYTKIRRSSIGVFFLASSTATNLVHAKRTTQRAAPVGEGKSERRVLPRAMVAQAVGEDVQPQRPKRPERPTPGPQPPIDHERERCVSRSSSDISLSDVSTVSLTKSLHDDCGQAATGTQNRSDSLHSSSTHILQQRGSRQSMLSAQSAHQRTHSTSVVEIKTALKSLRKEDARQRCSRTQQWKTLAHSLLSGEGDSPSVGHDDEVGGKVPVAHCWMGGDETRQTLNSSTAGAHTDIHPVTAQRFGGEQHAFHSTSSGRLVSRPASGSTRLVSRPPSGSRSRPASSSVYRKGSKETLYLTAGDSVGAVQSSQSSHAVGLHYAWNG